MHTYEVILTKVYSVKVEAENREHAIELFDRYGDWDEVLKVHTLDVNPMPLQKKEIVLKEGEDY
jgi:hypothetical protein